MALFQTIGALGEAKGLFAHAEAVATTALVLIIATADHVIVALRGALGWSRRRYPDRGIDRSGRCRQIKTRSDGTHTNDSSAIERVQENDLESLRPQKFPHQWLPEKLELKTWEQIEPWYQKLMEQPINSAAGPRALGGRGRRVERGCRRRKGRSAISR